MLFTGEVIMADEAKSLGMVNHVVSREELTDFTMAMAENIARRPMMGLKLAKQSVNQAEEAQGLYSSLQAAMSLQQLGHSHWRIVNENGAAVNLEGGALMKEIFDKHKKPKKAE
jgi:enoyl-CoA hydratase